MDELTKARLRLYLQSERAMGLTAICAGVTKAAPAQKEQPEPPQPGFPFKSPAQSPAPKTLFGSEAEAESTEAEGLAALPVAQAFTGPALSTEEKKSRLIAMNENEVRVCTKCRLCEQRTHTVFGEGDVDAKILFIGEGPGETEDQTGRPFVGRAGELLNKMIAAMGLKREQVYIANIVKCRPPGNRVPAPDEVATCTPYLERQLGIIRPGAIVTLGLPATQYMLQTKTSMGRLRGQWHNWRGIKLMPTYHPAYVLRNPTYETRSAVWSDLKQVLLELGLPVPKK
jgi:DNA polymerase